MRLLSEDIQRDAGAARGVRRCAAGHPRGLKPAARCARLKSRGPKPAARLGFVLLETLIATTLLVLGLAVIGTQVQRAYFETLEMERRTRALMLAESKLAELDTGLIVFDSLDEVMEEPFGPLFPDWGFRITVQPTLTEGLNQIHLEILYFMRNYDRDDFDFEQAKVIHELYTFRMTPRRIDLQLDYGMDEESVNKLNELLSGVGMEIPVDGFPLQDFLRSADIADIMSLLSDEELLQAMGGFSKEDILGALPREVRQALKGLEGGGDGSGDLGDEGDEEADE